MLGDYFYVTLGVWLIAMKGNNEMKKLALAAVLAFAASSAQAQTWSSVKGSTLGETRVYGAQLASSSTLSTQSIGEASAAYIAVTGSAADSATLILYNGGRVVAHQAVAVTTTPAVVVSSTDPYFDAVRVSPTTLAGGNDTIDVTIIRKK